MKTIARLSALGVLLLSLTGCGSSTRLPPAQAGDPQQPMDFGLLTDIPILAGASMDNERSLILGEKDQWTGRVVMKLGKTVPEAAVFYQQQMPAFGWEPIMAATSGVSVLSYVRGGRAATIQVEPGTMWGSTVSVTVAQRNPAAVAPASAPGGYAAPGGYGSSSYGGAPQGGVNSQPLR